MDLSDFDMVFCLWSAADDKIGKFAISLGGSTVYTLAINGLMLTH